MSIRRWCILVSFVFALPVAVSAQMEDLGAWWDRPIARNLGLSEAQEKEIRDVVHDSRDQLIRLRADVRVAEAALNDELAEDKVDIKKADAAVDRVVTARGELMRAVSLMSVRLRMILTVEQWQRLQRRGERRGMPDAPPPGRRRPSFDRPL